MDYFSLLSEKLGKEESEKRIDAKIASFSGLLTKEAAAKLIAAEEGLLKEEFVPISSIAKSAQNVSVLGKLKKMFPLQQYRTGKRSRSFILKDDTGEIEVKLWNEDADSLSTFHLGDKVKVRNAYSREGILNIGYRGKVELEEREEVLSPSTLKEGAVSCSGKASSIKGMEGNSFHFTISDGEKEAQVEMAHLPNRGEKISKGDTVLIEGAEWDGKRLLMGEHSRLLLKKNSPNIFRGELEDFEMGKEGATLKVGGEEFFARMEALVRFLKLEGLKEDIDLPAAAELKLSGMKGKRATILFEEREGRKVAKDISIR